MAEFDITESENKAMADEEIFKSLRDFLTVKITVPLGNPNFKNIHTNSFIYCNLDNYLNHSNFNIIAKAMNSTFSRFTAYEQNRWYVESVNINNDSGKYTMELELNPFPSTLKDYKKEYKSFIDAYENKQNQGENGTGVASTGNTTLKGGQGETIDNLVKQICGNITDELERCKAIHEWLRKNVIYSWYECSKSAYGKDPTKIYNNRTHINCADTATLTCAMMLSAGLKAYVVQRTYDGGHFWCIIEINGKRYASDQTGRESAGMSGSLFNTVWKRSGRTSVSDGGAYSKQCGSKACC